MAAARVTVYLNIYSVVNADDVSAVSRAAVDTASAAQPFASLSSLSSPTPTSSQPSQQGWLGSIVSGVTQAAHYAGLGAYHSGVVVHGREFGYGAVDQPNVSGVYECTPRSSPSGVFRETIEIGTTELTNSQVTDVIKKLASSEEFHGFNYHLLEHNCNHFSQRLCSELGPGVSLPAYVNRLSSIGSSFTWLLPESMQALSRAPGAPPRGQQSPAQASGNFVPFSGTGMALSSSGSTPTNDSPANSSASSTDAAAERRAKMAAAAELRKSST